MPRPRSQSLCFAVSRIFVDCVRTRSDAEGHPPNPSILPSPRRPKLRLFGGAFPLRQARRTPGAGAFVLGFDPKSSFLSATLAYKSLCGCYIRDACPPPVYRNVCQTKPQNLNRQGVQDQLALFRRGGFSRPYYTGFRCPSKEEKPTVFPL